MGYLEALPITRVRPVLYLPLWMGTLLDKSGNGNHGTNTGGHWGQQGDADGFNFGEINITADPSLQPANVTIFAWGDFPTQTSNQYIAALADNSTRFYLTATEIRFESNGVSGDLAAAVSPCRSLAVTATAELANPIFYQDGAYYGVGVLDVALDLTAQNWIVAGLTGSELGGPVSGVLVFPAVLTPAEISELHLWSQSRFTPRKQWPGGGLRYENRETNLWTDDGSLPGVATWTAAAGAVPAKVENSEDGRFLRVSGAAGGYVYEAGAFTANDQTRIILEARSDGITTPVINDAWTGAAVWTGVNTHQNWQPVDFLGFPVNAVGYGLRWGAGAGTHVDFRSIRAWTNPPGYTHATGDPLFLDNIQTARVSVGNETSGKLSNTDFEINTGTWRVAEDATGRYLSCVAAGQLQYDLIGAAGYVVDTFTETGTATITLNANNFQIDAGNGDIIRAVRILAG